MLNREEIWIGKNNFFYLEPLNREEFRNNRYIFNLVPLNEEEIQNDENDENICNLDPINGE